MNVKGGEKKWKKKSRKGAKERKELFFLANLATLREEKTSQISLFSNTTHSL